jgi:thioredoxin-like negative regulator of GroEL
MLARALDRNNPIAAREHARLKLAAGQYASALRTLQAAGNSATTTRMQLRAQLELQDASAAAKSAQVLATQSTADADLVLASLALLNAQNLGQKNLAPNLLALKASVTSPEALQRILRAEGTPLGLGAELYATGLLHASHQVHMKLPDSQIKSLILGKIAQQIATPDSLSQALTYYKQVLNENPANIEARQGLVAVYQQLGDTSSASRHQELLRQLQAGRP